MADVSLDVGVVRAVSGDILSAARELPSVGDPGIVGDGAVGSETVIAALGQVGLEQATRAGTAAEALDAAGRRPEVAVTQFTMLDRGLMGPV